MARSRLLILGLAVAVFLIFWLPLYDCGPIWARRLEGQVVDKATGKPVPGAEVFVNYWYESARAGVDWRWTTTDAEGRFVFPGHPAIYYFGRGGCVHRRDKYPTVEVLDPAYGVFALGRRLDPYWSWRDNRIEIERDATQLSIFERDRKHNDAGECNGMPSAARMRCCEVLYGADAHRICAPKPGTIQR
jgi:hypothetical protein